MCFSGHPDIFVCANQADSVLYINSINIKKCQ